jgi:hypothetical protein
VSNYQWDPYTYLWQPIPIQGWYTKRTPIGVHNGVIGWDQNECEIGWHQSDGEIGWDQSDHEPSMPGEYSWEVYYAPGRCAHEALKKSINVLQWQGKPPESMIWNLVNWEHDQEIWTSDPKGFFCQVCQP